MIFICLLERTPLYVNIYIYIHTQAYFFFHLILLSFNNRKSYYLFSWVQFSCSVMTRPWRPHGMQNARPPCPSPTPKVYSNSCPWFGDDNQSSHSLSSLSPPAFNLSQQSGSFPVSQFFTSGGQSIGVSASASVLPMNIQDWFPTGWTGWIYMQSKGHSRVFPNTTVQNCQFFGTQLSL